VGAGVEAGREEVGWAGRNGGKPQARDTPGSGAASRADTRPRGPACPRLRPPRPTHDLRRALQQGEHVGRAELTGDGAAAWGVAGRGAQPRARHRRRLGDGQRRQRGAKGREAGGRAALAACGGRGA
jgi:hypothetical protein